MKSNRRRIVILSAAKSGFFAMLAVICLITVGIGTPIRVQGQTQKEENTQNTYEMAADQTPQLDGFQMPKYVERVIDENSASQNAQTITASVELQAQNSEWTKYSSDYYYNQLTAAQKVLYDRLEAKAAYYMDSSDDLTMLSDNSYTIGDVNCSDLSLTVEQAQFVEVVFYESDGQYYYLENQYAVSHYSNNDNAVSATIYVYDKFAKGSDRVTYTQLIKNQIQDWENQISTYTSTYAKQKAIHDLICEQLTYGANTYDQSLASAILKYGDFNRTTVCTGYAKTFEVLCNGAGINTIITISDTHAWNVVEINGKWYYVDCTYDSSYYKNNQSPYLDISLNTMTKLDSSSVHQTVDSWKGLLPVCDEDYNSTVKNGVYIEDNGTINYYENGVVNTNYTGMAQDYATNQKYWFNAGTAVKNSEIYDTSTKAWYWFQTDGTMAVDKDVYIPTDTSGKWVRYDSDGKMVKGENYKNGGWYWFDSNTGEMEKGFVNIPDGTQDGKTVYYDETTGIMHHGESYVNGGWYWFDSNTGEMGKGFVNIPDGTSDGKTVYYDETTGVMRHGEGYINGGWYWFDPNTGEMAKGFLNIPDGTQDGKWVYYDESTGVMHHGESYINGGWYRFDSSTGKMIHGEFCDANGNWYLYDTDTGIMYHNQVYFNNHWYYYDSVTGIMQKGWVYVDGEWHLYDSVTGVRVQ